LTLDCTDILHLSPLCPPYLHTCASFGHLKACCAIRLFRSRIPHCEIPLTSFPTWIQWALPWTLVETSGSSCPNCRRVNILRE
jgi:hypothetical protein